MTRHVVGAAALILSAYGCDEPTVSAGPPAILSFEVEPASVTAGGEIHVHLEVENFAFGSHEEVETTEHEHAEEEGGVQTGHAHIYLDDVLTNPLVMLESHEGTAIVPATTTPGAHVLIARLQDVTHEILVPEITAEADLEVLPLATP